MTELITQIGALIAAHAWAGIAGLITAGLVTVLAPRNGFWPTWNNPFRTFLGGLAIALGMVFNRVQDGGAWMATTISVFAAVWPTLAAEFVAWRKNSPASAAAAERGHSLPEALFFLSGLSMGGVALYAAVCMTLPACSGVKIDPKFIGKTIEQIAYEACSLFAQDQAPILNQDVEATVTMLCGTADLLKPFVDDLLASKRKASLKFAASHPQYSDAGSMPAEH